VSGLPSKNADRPAPALTLFDSTCLIVGIIVGAGIYQTAPDVARSAGSAWGVLALWLCGGVLSLCGALGYAELASAYPREGGDYVYLGRAYGPWAGFLFGWAQLAVVRPGDIAVMAFVFGTYAQSLCGPGAGGEPFFAVAAVGVLTLINVLGVPEGKWTQNVLTIVKVFGLLAVVGIACGGTAAPTTGASAPALPMSVALILVLFTFGGWNEMAYVAAEVRDARRNLARALVIGTAVVTALYVLVNAAFLHSLGFAGLTHAHAVAAEVVARVFPASGQRLISALICLSALGALNGLIFTGARITYALGTEHRVFAWFGRWEPRTGTPVRALLLQGALAAALVLALGSFLNAILYTAATVYAFYLATTLAVFVLRRKEPQVERPYRLTGYPVTPLLFSAVCAFLIYSAICYKPHIAALSCLLVPSGLLLFWFSNRQARRPPPLPR
jgi:amino acid transporter